MLCDRMKIDIWEVVDAASTKPYGFMRFEPGPGMGGHCLPVDPFYLAWKAREYDVPTEFIELAGEVNQEMPHFCADKIAAALNDHSKPVRGSKIVILGVAYKRDVGDVRESPALDIIKLLADRGADIRYNDPHAEEVAVDGGRRYRSVPLTAGELQEADLVVIVTNHTSYDYDFIVRHSQCVLDTLGSIEKALTRPRPLSAAGRRSARGTARSDRRPV